MFARLLKRSEEADLGLCMRGGLQLLDDDGDENGLDVEFSPKCNEDAIVGDFSCSGAEDIALEILVFPGKSVGLG